MASARQWLKYLIIIGLFLGAQVGFETIAGGRQLSLTGVHAVFTLPGVLAIAAWAFLEELLFDGLLLHELAELLPHWGAILLTSLLFAAIHLPFWLWHGGLSTTMLTNTVGVFIFTRQLAACDPAWVAQSLPATRVADWANSGTNARIVTVYPDTS